MIKFFRQIRQNLIMENKTSKYLKYAIGEIVLVVIGILIALQINNWNENRKARNTESTYLENISADLQLNLSSLENFIAEREKSIEASANILPYFDRTAPLDVNKFNKYCVTVMVWYPFEQHNNTYQELLNSGKLNTLSNKAIKDQLQDMQTSFKRIAFVENEMQQDFESYLYDPFFTTIDLNSSLKNFEQQDTNQVIETELNIEQVTKLLNNQAFKNGFVLSSFNSKDLISEYSKMITTTKNLINMIENELKQ
ncbi:DUF6090 family protein [Geojedonia litorea]|uniref:DUF6090 family protein n=1 Tax=Geojedonia litorea TaxID=1268269 RepID=A0ABV9MY10_9FLAO